MSFLTDDRIDLERLKHDADLIDLIRGDTRLAPKCSSRPLGEHAGPCPFCGGHDRFVVWPTGRADGTPPMWMCRHCTPDGGSAIDYVMRREHLSFTEAVDWMSGDGLRPAASGAPGSAQPPSRPAADIEAELERAERLAEYWGRRANGLRAELGAHPEVVASLKRDGITADAALHFDFGYTVHQSTRALVIPWRYCHQGREIVTGVQYRALLGDRFDGGDPRYRWRTGSRGKALFNADAILEPEDDTLVVVEGAKKAAALWGHHLTSTVAIASKTGWDPAWAPRLAGFDRVIFALDPDADEQAVAAARSVPGRAFVARLPMKPDDLLVVTGGDVALLRSYIEMARKVD